ncbi:MAG TPA: zinc metalloprotease HtpX [Candidatus Nanoarchaeia archaeon]|nr:zinc metalloprotease HtpX [Candidatus Nanoarchaeia archaeon]
MSNNQLKTIVFLGLLSGLLLAAGWLIGGTTGITIGLGIALVTNAGSYWFSDKIVLALYRAKPADEKEYKHIHQMVEELAAKARIPKPRIYIINSPQANAFATGRNPEHAVVACTTGILQLLTKEELRGVLGHELSHITNRDILISSVAAGIAAVISYIAFVARWAAIFGGGRDRENNGLELIVLAIVTPIIATLLQLAISRSREYLADSSGAKLTGHPEHLATALEKISGSVHAHPLAAHASTTATAHLFISNPFRANAFLNLLSTHPPAQERVRRLRAMR